MTQPNRPHTIHEHNVSCFLVLFIYLFIYLDVMNTRCPEYILKNLSQNIVSSLGDSCHPCDQRNLRLNTARDMTFRKRV